jgi:hypothetical protein
MVVAVRGQAVIEESAIEVGRLRVQQRGLQKEQRACKKCEVIVQYYTHF